MKKFIMFSALAWLLGLSHAAANEIIINDITVPQGGEAELVVGYNFATDTKKIGATFMINLPEGLSFGLDEYGDVAYEKGECLRTMNVIVLNGNSFGIQIGSGTASITGTSGDLLTLHIAASSDLAVGSTHEVQVTKATFTESVSGVTKDIFLDDFTFNVTIGEPDDGRIKFNETSTKLPKYTAGEKGNVTMTRTIKANSWSTIVLPFTLTMEKARDAFGYDVHLAEFKDFETNYGDDEDNVVPLGITLNFATYTLTSRKSMVGGKLYLIKTSEDIESFEADEVTMVSEVTDVSAADGDNTSGKFTGSFIKTVVPADGLFIAENKFWYSTGKTNIKAFRGWFELGAVVGKDTDFGAKVGFFIDGQPTSIDGIGFNGGQMIDGAVYTLGGQLVGKDVKLNQLKKGVYIRNGKKFVVK